MGLGLKFFRFIGREYYKDIPINLLFVNFIFQRILRLNSDFPYSCHYTSRIIGYKHMVVPKSSLYTFAACGGYYIVASEKSPLILGENVIFSYNVSIFTLNHDFEDRKKYIYKSVKIGNNCWIGNSVSIMPGVELGNNVTIGANAVVTKSFPSNVVIAGNPARVIKELP